MKSGHANKDMLTTAFSRILLPIIFIYSWSLTCLAADQWLPSKGVEVVVPGGGGGGIDSVARAIQSVIQEKKLMKQPFTIVNKPGGSASIGLTYLSRLPADGHYIAMGSGALLTNHITGRSSLQLADFSPIAQLFTESISFSVEADSPIKTGRDLLNRLKADPGSIRVGLPSIASTNHIASALILKSLGVDPKLLKTVIFNSSAAGITAVLGGHIELVAAPAANTIPFMKAGTLRVIAVSAEKRLSGEFSNVPTLKELGSDVVIGAYRSALGPKGMSSETISYWEELLRNVVQSKEWKDYLAKNSWEDNFLGAKESALFLNKQYKGFHDVLSELGMVKIN